MGFRDQCHNSLFAINEAFSKGKGKEKFNEDCFVITNDFAAVIDGATSKSEFRWDGKTTGKIASEIIYETICQLPTNINAEEAIIKITERIHHFYTKHGILNKIKANPVFKISASAVIYSAYLNEVWQIGDCPCIIGQKYYPNKKDIDRIISEARSVFLESEISRGVSLPNLIEHDLGRDFIFPLLVKQTILQNHPLSNQPYTFAVFDGFPINMEQVNIYPVGKEKIIILSSDGYPKLFPTLQKTEDYLAQILKEDPLCFRKFKNTKGLVKGNVSFDDRTYLRLTRLL
jgi:hypothetical protein